MATTTTRRGTATAPASTPADPDRDQPDQPDADPDEQEPDEARKAADLPKLGTWGTVRDEPEDRDLVCVVIGHQVEDGQVTIGVLRPTGTPLVQQRVDPDKVTAS